MSLTCPMFISSPLKNDAWKTIRSFWARPILEGSSCWTSREQLLNYRFGWSLLLRNPVAVEMTNIPLLKGSYRVYVYIYDYQSTTWKVDGATPTYWFIIAPFLSLVLVVAPSTFTTVSLSWLISLSTAAGFLPSLVGGWTYPSEKYARQIGSLP